MNSSKELKIPLIGIGTYKMTKSEVFPSLKKAIELGYRHIDCAYYYENEKEIGDALKQIFSEGLVKREELFITSKLWRIFHSPEKS